MENIHVKLHEMCTSGLGDVVERYFFFWSSGGPFV